MPTYFLDSSVVVKYYVTEPGSSWVRMLVHAVENSNLVCEISIPEVAAALSQMRQSKHFGKKFMRETFTQFQNDLRRGLFFPRPLDRELIDRAAALALDYGLSVDNPFDHVAQADTRRRRS